MLRGCLRHLAALAVLVPLVTAAQEGAPFVERMDVRVVEVDVVVTDRRGNPIPGLTRDDFELFEDGKRVEITNFSRIVDGQLELQPDAVAASAPRAVPQRSPVTWAVFLDQSDLSPGRRNFSIRELRKFLDGAVANGDRGIVGSYDGYSFRIQQSVTDERKHLLDAVSKLEKLPSNRGPVYLQGTLIRSDIQRATEEEEIGLLTARIGWMVEQETVRTKNAILNLRAFVDVVAGQEGRVAVIYVGAGFNTLPGVALYDAFARRYPDDTDQIHPTPQEQRPLVEREMTGLLERLSAMRATFYPIFAADRFSAISPEDPGSIDTQGGVEGGWGELTQEATVHELADRTGGQFFKSAPRLAARLAAMESDLKHYYSLAYMPKGEMGKKRDLRVAVKVQGARVRHRETARERTPEEEAGDAVVAALFERAPANPLGVSVVTGEQRRVRLGTARLLEVSAKVPLARLTFIPDGAKQRAGLSIHFAMASEDGSVWRVASRELPVEIAEADLADARAQHLSYKVEVPLLAGNLRLAVSVQDQYGGQASVVTIPIRR